MSVPTAHRTPTAGARTGTLSTAEIKTRIAAMFADEPTDVPDPTSRVRPQPN
ncbi:MULTISPECIES: AMP-binding protein [unclassified Rhodococcus (in: high G+C Gram-positive bacteria)]|uniref:AMP-binding protein n=1 Tax=unclassified Rhodococcus (in: high G+C Gram-positive bacteria) TaxID=192944 RepID=UPI00163AB905|nr:MULTISPECIES: AMP-binding protein [unclassified Rhodococcus (in: high G+C Gram-positive bacteria)]MBC2644323.1 AMP-binding protein [Rhodococcus sp. 3A]MBC2897984.1 AMP-binding protein [Rhodococcus sp. 4CII]